ncbi:MAG: GTP 3',8-cyclase MoaA [Thermosphaera sp.]
MDSNYLVDRFNRKVNSVRLVVTARCNYNCIFCHREGLSGLKRTEILNPEDYGFLAKVSRKLGIVDFKITGGEPLIRKDIIEIIEEIKKSIENISITTNGYFLADLAPKLANAGLERVNVSLHSLNDEIYRRITRTHVPVRRILEGIDLAVENGIRVKLNFLAMKINVDEFNDVLDYASRKGLDINVIELIPLGTPPKVYMEQKVNIESIVEKLKQLSSNISISEFQSRPIFTMPSGIKVTVIKGFENPSLCSKCTRIRVTPEGWIKTCIFVEEPYVDISRELKSKDENGLIEKFKQAVALREPYFKFQIR